MFRRGQISMAENDQQRKDMLALYVAKGWALVPVMAGAKRCSFRDWPNRQFGTEALGSDDNVGLKTGSRSRHIADVDLDCPEAIELASIYLPETGAIFGRPSKPRSHWLYVAVGASFVSFADPIAGDMLVELRADGLTGGCHMTIIPPSVTDGEARQWCGDAIGPAPIDHRILRRRCALLATGALVYRYVGTTPARTPWKPGWDHPRLLWECDHELGRRACGWLGKPAPDEPTRRQRAERSPIDVELDELAAAITNNHDFNGWNRIGMAFYVTSGGSQAGFVAFDDFSAKSPKYDPRETVARWRNYGRSLPSRLGKGTLIWEARQSGWRPGGRRYG